MSELNKRVEETSGEFYKRMGMDGHLWSQEMHKVFPQIPQDDFLAWCCNMVMAGYDGGIKDQQARIEELEKREVWQPIETAPVGEPGMDVGSRESSEPFFALKKSGEVVKVRRMDSSQSYDFAGYDELQTYYLQKCFTHWRPLSPKDLGIESIEGK